MGQISWKKAEETHGTEIWMNNKISPRQRAQAG